MKANPLPDLDCACANLRRAARLVTQLYSHEMGGQLEPTQFALLTALDRLPGSSHVALGEALGLDKTSLSRNLRLMERNGWVQVAESEDLRRRGYRLTTSGRRLLTATKPRWKQAQSKLRNLVTSEDWETMQRLLVRVASAARQAQGRA
jgi:DNA-binding MarR family transcriptional regulator